jgi:hypothetical protein
MPVTATTTVLNLCPLIGATNKICYFVTKTTKTSAATSAASGILANDNAVKYACVNEP